MGAGPPGAVRVSRHARHTNGTAAHSSFPSGGAGGPAFSLSEDGPELEVTETAETITLASADTSFSDTLTSEEAEHREHGRRSLLGKALQQVLEGER